MKVGQLLSLYFWATTHERISDDEQFRGLPTECCVASSTKRLQVELVPQRFRSAMYSA
jgi:hypothetical protein